VKNYVPNAKFKRVDFPEDCGPITHTTITWSFLENLTNSLINVDLNSRFSPSISSKQSPFLIYFSTDLIILIFSSPYFHSVNSVSYPR
jgi:hypothetical protein